MPGESQQLPTTGSADPSVFTSDAIIRSATAERDYVKGEVRVLETRLNSMDEATKVLQETVTRTPTDIQKAIANLHEVTDERFAKSHEVMNERFQSLKDILTLLESQRVEMKQDTEKAVQAALAAAKEAVREQTTASEKSILKSETATAEQIRQQGVTSTTAIAGVVSNAEDLKERVARIESRKEGASELRQQAQPWQIWAAGATISMVVVIVNIAVLLLVK